MSKPPDGTTELQQATSYGIVNIRRHILFCAGPDCCDPRKGEEAWNYLKRRIAELKLDRAPTHVYRTRCQCLRVCTKGPIAVVHPDGTWYHSANTEVIERILQEHILEGHVVKENAFVENPLG
jgi:(2Fe-2S) ferredoxin